MSAESRKLNILANDGRAVIVAMDHGRTDGAVKGLEDPGRVLDIVLDAGADAVLTTIGVLKHYRDRLVGRVPVLLRIDGGPSSYREDWLSYTQWRRMITVNEAVALGASGVCVMAFIGSKVELDTLEIVTRTVVEAAGTNVPVVVEALPCRSERIPDPLDSHAMADAARLAFEHGADLIKTYYTGSVQGFRAVTTSCPVPCLVAGGPRMASRRAALEAVKEAIEAGARGVVFGRNIWQDLDPGGMTRALVRIVHDTASVDEVLAGQTQ